MTSRTSICSSNAGLRDGSINPIPRRIWASSTLPNTWPPMATPPLLGQV